VIGPPRPAGVIRPLVAPLVAPLVMGVPRIAGPPRGAGPPRLTGAPQPLAGRPRTAAPRGAPP